MRFGTIYSLMGAVALAGGAVLSANPAQAAVEAAGASGDATSTTDAVPPGFAVRGDALVHLASGMVVPKKVGNAVLIEVIFSRQGLGRILYQAVTRQDIPLTIGVTLVVTVVYILASTIADILFVLVDPRIKAATR